MEAKDAKKPDADKKAAAKPKRSAWFPQGKKNWADMDEEDEQKAPTPLDVDSHPVHPAVRRAVQCTLSLIHI